MRARRKPVVPRARLRRHGPAAPPAIDAGDEALAPGNRRAQAHPPRQGEAMSALESIFSWVLTASWQASVLALLVLVAQATLGRRLNPRWRYALWLLVVLRLVLPSLPESPFSLFRFAPAA